MATYHSPARPSPPSLQSTASIFRTSPANAKFGAVDHRPCGPYGAIWERGAFGPATLRSGRAAARLDNRNVSRSAQTIVDIATPFLARRLRNPASPLGRPGLSERQLTGFQMMTFFIVLSPGAGATLP